jgi:hypothetical protein
MGPQKPIWQFPIKIPQQILSHMWNGFSQWIRALKAIVWWKNHGPKISWNCPFKQFIAHTFHITTIWNIQNGIYKIVAPFDSWKLPFWEKIIWSKFLYGYHGLIETKEADSTVSLKPQNPLLQSHWNTGIWYCCHIETAESNHFIHLSRISRQI